MLRSFIVAFAAAVCLATSAGATTYESVTFNELVARADVIFIGEVIDVRPFALDTRDGRIIKTRVTFRVSDPVWGTTSSLELLEFLGGELDGIGLEVAEMPKFSVGDRRVVFARRERSVSPIVGFRQGLFQITRDRSGVDRVLTIDGLPLERPENLGTRSPALTPVGGTPMRLADFRDRISRTLAAARRR